MAYNEKQKEYTINYMKENLDEIKFRVPKGQKENIRNHAQSMGEKLTPFIIRAIHETMERDSGHYVTQREPQKATLQSPAPATDTSNLKSDSKAVGGILPE